MKQTNQVVETLLSSTHVMLDKHISVQQLLISSLIALGGIVAIVLMMLVDESDSTLSMAQLTIGVILLIYALYRFFMSCIENESLLNKVSTIVDNCFNEKSMRF